MVEKCYFCITAVFYVWLKEAGSVLLAASAFNLMLYVVLAEIYKENSASHRL